MSGKVVLVTGATNGIGKVAARELAKMGATTVIVGRNPDKTQTTIAEIKQASANSQVHGLIADLSVMDSVRSLAEEFKRNFDRLDVLLNNAGAVFSERQETADSLERTFALNHLNYFLLTNLLLDVLKRSAPARIVNVSSDAHRMVRRMNFEDLNSEKSWGIMGWKAYGQSKLANILFTRELARQLEGSGVTANAVHPGGVSTGFGKNNGGLMALMMKAAGPLFMKTPEQGAETLIYLASAPEVQGVSGGYFADRHPVEPSPAAKDDAAAQRLWEISAKWVGLAARV
ncbi:MAG: SDR family oxidoreductase [Anaerolineae bacterium]|nr:SDR family oxidoreductase [Anaerolineae bacterium]